MSDRMMSVDEARAVLELDSAPLPMRQAARTIVAQAEQIGRLQAAVRDAISTSGDGVDGLITEGIILPGDMEDQEVTDE